MSVVVITPPSPLVDLAKARGHLRVVSVHEDVLIDAYRAAASEHIDGPDGWLGSSIGPQVLELRLAACELPVCGPLRLPFGPVIALDSIKYDDADGVEQTFDAGNYRLTAAGQVELVDGASWSTSRSGSDAWRFRYSAGRPTLPGPIEAAVLLMVGDLYDNRGEAVIGTIAAQVKMSPTVENLLSPYRAW